MSSQANVYRVLIASPSDCKKERDVIKETINTWNTQNFTTSKMVLFLPTMWESNTIPEMGDRPQAIINKQIVDVCDVLIGVFWTRIGTNTGVAESGTVEEIQRFISSGKPTKLYFSNEPIPQSGFNIEQYTKLQKFKEECYPKGLIGDFNDVHELKSKINELLHYCAHEFLNSLSLNESNTTRIRESLSEKDTSLMGEVSGKEAINVSKVNSGSLEQGEKQSGLVRLVRKKEILSTQFMEFTPILEERTYNGLSFKELMVHMTNEYIDVPKGLFGKHKRMNLITLFLACYYHFASGVTNSTEINNKIDINFLYINLGYKLMKLGLVTKIKETQVRFERIQVSELGIMFFNQIIAENYTD